MDVAPLFEEGISRIPGELIKMLTSNPKLMAMVVIILLIAVTNMMQKSKKKASIQFILAILLVAVGIFL